MDQEAIIVAAVSRAMHARIPCPFCSATRKKSKDQCMSIDRTEGGAVLYSCWHCSTSGAVRTNSFDTHLDNYYRSKPNMSAVQAAPTIQQLQPQELGSKELAYLESRGLSRSTCTLAGLYTIRRFIRTINADAPCIAFPYRENGRVIGNKYRSEAKQFSQDPGGNHVFYGLDRINIKDGELVITEGEIDALSCTEAGVNNAVSVPNGAPLLVSLGKADPAEDRRFACVWEARSILDKINKVVLAVDNDEPGQALQEELARRIGKEKCWVVTYPEGCKDANDVLVKHGPAALKQVIANATPFPISGLFNADHYAQDINDLYNKRSGRGLDLGIAALKDLYSVQPGQVTVVTGCPSMGKALALDTSIPTPTGWTTMGALRVGDPVYDENGDVCHVIKATEIMLNRQCYQVTFEDGASVVADANHEWLTKSRRAYTSAASTRKKRGTRTTTLPRGTDQRHKTARDGVVTTALIAKTIKHVDHFNHRIKNAAPVCGVARRLPIPPYTLGAWLGDGSADSGSFTSADIEIIERIRKDGFTVTKHSRKYGWGILKLEELLKRASVLGNKFIPSIYLRADAAARLELLRGLLDTDGCCSPTGQIEYCSTSPVLATGVKELIESLGIKCRMSESPAKLYGVQHGIRYRIQFSTSMMVFHLSRKAKRISTKKSIAERAGYRTIVACEAVQSVPVKCIMVDSPSHLFLCTKQFIATHNSNLVDQFTINLARSCQFKTAYCSFENTPAIHIARLMEIVTEKPFFEQQGGGNYLRMTEAEKAKALAWINRHFTFIDFNDADLPTIDAILMRARVAVQRLGIRGLVIDPYNYIRMERRGTETDEISEMLSKVQAFAKANDVHTWFVAHPTKMYGNDNRPNGATISGSAAWWSKADCGLTVHRGAGEQVHVDVWKCRYRWIGKQGEAMIRFNPLAGTYEDLSDVPVFS